MSSAMTELLREKLCAKIRERDTEIDRLTAEIERLRADNKRLRLDLRDVIIQRDAALKETGT